MLVPKDNSGDEEKKMERVEDLRLRDNEFEIQKYMQDNIKPVHLPDMPNYMRAENKDPGQSSPRS